ncbi:hypothetical protein ACFY2N_34360 [Streptomyces rubiginosohelvolus]|uniref:hypothetical protein n=1 Tax=Streptomyces rubiginosohelvolus TaxID=67362 RepID=UPI0036B4CEEA
MYRSAAPAGPAAPAPPHGEGRGPLDTSHIPFIALTEGEGRLDFTGLKPGADGWITYANPGPYDRYPETEVLLARTAGAVPGGRPDGNVLSPYRHAHCTLNRLCQGCGAPAARGDDGLLHVLPATRPDGSPAATSGITDMPPSCARCALHRCPVLAARGRKLLWAKEAEVIGVYAEVFAPPRLEKGVPTLPSSLSRLSDQLVPFDDVRTLSTLSASVATRFVCDLRRVTEADPRHVTELARQQTPHTPTGTAGRGRAESGRARREAAAGPGRSA